MNEDDKKENLNRIADDMNSKGLLFSDLFQILKDQNSAVLNLTDTAFERFASVYDKLDSGEVASNKKGKLLEDLIAVLFEEGYPAMFEVKRNQRTSSNEIDLLINWSQSANGHRMQLLEKDLGSSFLVECKNYENRVEVTYLGKFISLMGYTKTRLGIFVAWNGITGSNNSWNDAVGLVKKIALAEEKYILVLSKKDLLKIRQKQTNVFTLLEDKYRALKNDISYENYIQDHEIELDGSWE
ncbi:hypothetical protein BTI50_08485 [Lactobacillus delbrueckii subsp. bulgaricus]|nr:hypothetical protein [Lactobacillus delbrueckii subsp. bulgaricus]MBT8937355.1 hypothetical protein [Lactobacillus delbrueckii subsp. bulgaricus]MBT8948210.1 hypothetical protein [Lactobacillus delbrueckii subsp. bulgaricus]MBT8952437.1 hypothetical protein [Lactobacillus delbrueckii subsp. bulgaricus]MBT9020304.1 hypothetical protein [Lactobacillus delbrueckii subsp. bulgaricus]